MENKTEILGRKLFCIDVPERYCNSLLKLLVRNEYEVYCTSEKQNIDIILNKFPWSLLFVYIGPEDTEQKRWEVFLAEQREKIKEDDFRFIFFYENSTVPPIPAWPCIDVSPGITDTITDSLVEKLEAVHARGQRRYVRFGGTDKVNVAFSFTVKNKEYNGFVDDISSAGMSCALDKDANLELNSYIDRIALTLLNKTYTITGKILLQRWLDDEKRLFVLMFDRRMPEEIREVIQDFIQSSLQAQMDAKLA